MHVLQIVEDVLSESVHVVKRSIICYGKLYLANAAAVDTADALVAGCVATGHYFGQV